MYREQGETVEEEGSAASKEKSFENVNGRTTQHSNILDLGPTSILNFHGYLGAIFLLI